MVGRHVEGQLLRWREGRLPQSEMARVEAHLAACAPCRTAAAEIDLLVDSLNSVPRIMRSLPAHSPLTWHTLWARVYRPAAQRFRPQWAAYAAILAAFVALTAVLPHGGQPVYAAAPAGLAQTPGIGFSTPVVHAGADDDIAGRAVFGAPEQTISPAGTAGPIPIPTPTPGQAG